MFTEGIVHGTEHEAGGGAGSVGREFGGVSAEHGRTVGRRRHESVDLIEQTAAALVVHGRSGQHGHHFAGKHALAQTESDLLVGEGAFFEIAFHQLFVGRSDVFDGGIAEQHGFVFKLGGDGYFGGSTVIAEAESLAREHVHEPDELFVLKDGQVQDDGTHAELVGEAGESIVEAGAFTVHLGDNGDDGKTGGLHALPHAAHLGAHAVHGVHDHHSAVGGGEQPFDVAGEVGVAGHVDEIVAAALPVEGGEAGLDGAAALDFFRFVVQCRGAFFDGAEAIDDAGLEKKHFGKRGLAAAAGAHKGVGTLFFYGHTNLR